MIHLDNLVAAYPAHLRHFRRAILREYLQYKLLDIIFTSPYADKLCFLGGTCLRIVHGNTRFSEDLDFDNWQLTHDSFENLAVIICKELAKEGYEAEKRNVFKGAYHCYIRFPNLLYQKGLTGHKEEKILIQLDTQPQHVNFTPQKVTLNKFGIFTTIATTPLDLLLAQKLFAILNRPRTKGRDFFDVTFLLGKGAKPDMNYLRIKRNITSTAMLKDALLAKCSKLDMEAMAKDVAPFLFSPKDVVRVSRFVAYLKSIDFTA